MVSCAVRLVNKLCRSAQIAKLDSFTTLVNLLGLGNVETACNLLISTLPSFWKTARTPTLENGTSCSTLMMPSFEPNSVFGSLIAPCGIKPGARFNTIN